MRTALNIVMAGSLAVALSACGAKNSVPNDVQCLNPIFIKDSSMRRVRHMSEMPAGQFQLSSLQVYLVNTSSKDSFTASASSMDNFSSVSIDCSGVRSSGRSFTANFMTGSSVDFLNNTYGLYSYNFSFGFNNGQLVTASTGTTPNSAFVFGQTLSDSILRGRTVIKSDATMRVALYTPTATLVDVRVERDSAADLSGNQILEFLRAVYKRM